MSIQAQVKSGETKGTFAAGHVNHPASLRLEARRSLREHNTDDVVKGGGTKVG